MTGFPSRSSADDHAPAAIFVLRAHVARNPNSQFGLSVVVRYNLSKGRLCRILKDRMIGPKDILIRHKEIGTTEDWPPFGRFTTKRHYDLAHSNALTELFLFN